MDRQDIDALLVGALYGELTPADEARLAAHLEAHPADRGALDDLKSARAKVRESRIFEDAGSVEPPQHISALLLQEAHRRAPKRAVATDGEERESWFFRLTRMFLAHPAMAAAAMLVLVVGVAGTMYVKKGANFAERTAPSTAAQPPGGPQAVAAGSAAMEAAPSYNAQLADQGDLAEGTAAQRWDNENEKKEADNKPAVVATKPKPEPERRRAEGIMVETEQQQPKDFRGAKDSAKIATAPAKAASSKGSVAKNDAYRDYDGAADDRAALDTTTATTTAPSNGYGRGVVGGAASGGGGVAGPSANTGMAQPPPPPPSAPSGNFAAAPKQDVAQDKKTATVAKAPPSPTSPAPTATPQDSSLIGWAKSTHAQVIAKVKAGDCQGAAKLALAVSNRAPEYYSQYMATDRQLKSCKQYIDNERDKDAEKANKTRAQKRVNADEAMPAPTTTK